MVNGRCGLPGVGVLPNVTVGYKQGKDNVISLHRLLQEDPAKGTFKNGGCAILFSVQVKNTLKHPPYGHLY